MPDARAEVSREKLSEWLAEEIRKFPDCGDCKSVSVYRLQEPDEDGCNWSIGGGSITATSVPRQIWEPALANVAVRARKLFNLAED